MFPKRLAGMQPVRRARGTSSFHDSGAQWGSPYFTLQGCLSLVTYPVLGAGTQQTACSPLSSGEGLRPKVGTECAVQIGRGGWVEGVPTKASWPGRWRREPVPGQGAELSPAPCVLAAGGKAEQRDGVLNQLVPVHTCTHIYTHSHHTQMPQAHGHVHTYMLVRARAHTHGRAHTHTRVLQRLDFVSGSPPLAAPLLLRRKIRGHSQLNPHLPLPGKRGPGGRPSSPSPAPVM